MMDFNRVSYSSLAAILGATAALVVVADGTFAAELTAAEIAELAISTTVQINDPASGGGSGAIVAREGSIYLVLTANHVVDRTDVQYQVVTSSGQVYPATEIIRLPQTTGGPDLALVSFVSSEELTVGTLGNSDDAVAGSDIYVSGFPAPGLGSVERSHEFTSGIVTSRPALRPGGYTMRYSALTRSGMSGGPVFDAAGRIIGIHGQGDVAGEVNNESGSSVSIKTGFNAAIPVSTFLSLISSFGLDSSILNVDETRILLSRASLENPQTARDFYARGLSYLEKNQYEGALNDFSSALRIDDTLADAYARRATVRISILRTQNLGQNDGFSREEMSDIFEDLNRAISIDPENFFAYLKRAAAYSLIGEHESGLLDANRAIDLNPGDGSMYVTRSFIYFNLEEHETVIRDCNTALELNLDNSDTATAYNNRSLSRYYLGDRLGAIEDLNRAIDLDPQPHYYLSRGSLKYNLGDQSAGIQDVERAASLALEQGNMDYYEELRHQATRMRRGCYIATATLQGGGSEEQLDLLRSWRDEVLKETFVGELLLSHYKRVGPTVANYIADRRFLANTFLYPFIFPAVWLVQQRQLHQSLVPYFNSIIYTIFLTVLAYGSCLYIIVRGLQIISQKQLSKNPFEPLLGNF
jgi:tetratricopeptide (TPR) repeat protein